LARVISSASLKPINVFIVLVNDLGR